MANIYLSNDEIALLENLIKIHAKTCQYRKEGAESEAENLLYDERQRKALRVLAKLEEAE
jgi:hypothetical protein